jgi:hypothetical protein
MCEVKPKTIYLTTLPQALAPALSQRPRESFSSPLQNQSVNLEIIFL